MGRVQESTTTQLSVGMYACQRWRLKFSDESYIGHKNKSSRAIGSYKRSKSAAALPSLSTSDINAGSDVTEDGGAFPDKKLSQNSWNSEWALPPPPPLEDSSTPPRKEDLSRLSSVPSVNAAATHNPLVHKSPQASSTTDVSGGQDTTPVRPARPSALSRQGVPDPNSSQTTSPAFSSHTSPPSHHSHFPPDSTTVTGTPVFTARPFVVHQAGRPGLDNANTASPRRAPPPVPDSPPFEPSKNSPLARTQPSPGQSSNHSNPSTYPQSSPSSYLPQVASSSSSFTSPSSVSSSPLSSSHPRSWQSPDTASSQWSSPHNVQPKASHNMPASSHASNINANNYNTSNHNNNILKPRDSQLPPSLPPPREPYQQRRESEPLKPNSFNSSTPGSASQPPPLHRPKSEGSGLNVPPSADSDGSPGTSCHSRQPSQEELEYDLKARQLAEELGEKDVKLSEVLSLDTDKKRMRYMDGLFSSEPSFNGDGRSPSQRNDQDARVMTSSPSARDSPKEGSSVTRQGEEDPSKRPSLPKEYWLSAPKAQVEMTLRHNQEAGNDLTRDIKDGQSLVQQKEELLKKLRKKLDVLEDDKVQLMQEIDDNNSLGLKVDSMLSSKFTNMPGVLDKYKAYMDDQDKIVRLLLNLSGQLARAENAVESIPYNADSKLKKLTNDKRDRLHAKHEEAKILKADIDKRKDQLSVVVQEGLGEGEWQRYQQFVNKKPQLTIELQELEDKIKLGTEQMEELKKSIPNTS